LNSSSMSGISGRFVKLASTLAVAVSLAACATTQSQSLTPALQQAARPVVPTQSTVSKPGNGMHSQAWSGCSGGTDLVAAAHIRPRTAGMFGCPAVVHPRTIPLSRPLQIAWRVTTKASALLRVYQADV
jgi:hypothetical protein